MKARLRECQLHRDSPLGDTLLECYACGSRNAFALGFVPVKSENSVVLLCRRAGCPQASCDLPSARYLRLPGLLSADGSNRDTAPSAPGLKELALDLTLWQPLIEDRAFVPWLVKHPSNQALPRAVCWTPCAWLALRRPILR